MKDELTEEEQEKTLQTLSSQLIEIRKQSSSNTFYTIKVTCPECKRKIGMLYLYRCFQCGLWICIKCAEKHFGIIKKDLPKLIKSKKDQH
jgi:ribosomal protein L37AE/L43A